MEKNWEYESMVWIDFIQVEALKITDGNEEKKNRFKISFIKKKIEHMSPLGTLSKVSFYRQI